MPRFINPEWRETVDDRRHAVEHAAVEIEIEDFGEAPVFKERQIIIDHRQPILALQFFVPGDAVVAEGQNGNDGKGKENGLRGKNKTPLPLRERQQTPALLFQHSITK